MTEPDNNEPISIREYARRKNMTDTYIRRMIKDGIIGERCLTTHPTNGRPMILPLFAEQDWAMNYSTKGEVNPHRFRKSKKTYVKKKTPPSGELPDVSQFIDSPPVNTPSGTLQDGRKTKAELDRLLAEVKLQTAAIELREKKGQLVEKDKVYKALYEIGQELRKDIMSVPDKTLDNIRAAKTRQEALAIFNAALVDALTNISNIKEGDIRFKMKR